MTHNVLKLRNGRNQLSSPEGDIGSLCVQMSDSLTEPSVSLAMLADNLGFEALAVYLWEMSGVDEPVPADEPDEPDDDDDIATMDSVSFFPRPDVEDIVEPTRTRSKPLRAAQSSGFGVLQEEEEAAVVAEQQESNTRIAPAAKKTTSIPKDA